MFLSKVRGANAGDIVLEVHTVRAASSAFHLYLTGNFTEHLKARRGETCCYADGTDGGRLLFHFMSVPQVI